MDKEFYDTADIARELGITRQMVWKYVKDGRLIPLSPNKHYNIFTRAEFERFVRDNAKGFKKRADNV